MIEQKSVPKLRFSEFDNDWLLNSTEIKILAGNAYKLNEYMDNGYLLIQGLHIQPNNITLEEKPKYVSREGGKHLKIVKGDIVLGLNRPITNNQLKACRFNLESESVLYQRAGKLAFDVSKIDSEFLYQYLKNNKFMKQLEVQLIGSDQPYIRSNLFQATKNIFPTFPEQQKIASFLSKVDKKIELLTEKKAKLTEYKKGVIQQLFNGSFSHVSHSAQNSLGEQNDKPTFIPPTLRFKADDGSEFPDWEEKKLEALAELTSSKRVYSSDYSEVGVPFFRGKEVSELRLGIMPEDILYITKEAFIEFKDKYGAPVEGDILITAVGTLANVLRVNGEFEFYFKDGNLIWLRDPQCDSKFLSILLDASKNKILQTAIGSSQKALTIIELKKIVVSLPTLLEQQKMATFISAIDQKIDLANTELEKAKHWKKGLLQQMFV
tara:strand:- start:2522 stop:3829 length:1308 start_codon:yes stop_codon:yes gene_type:complete